MRKEERRCGEDDDGPRGHDDAAHLDVAGRRARALLTDACADSSTGVQNLIKGVTDMLTLVGCASLTLNIASHSSALMRGVHAHNI